jgi:beta-catenin-like protein 1
VQEELLADGEEIGTEEDAWYLRRLDGGMFTLQTVDYILAWVSMEDDGVSGTTFHARIWLKIYRSVHT